jgi:hypothetical protein
MVTDDLASRDGQILGEPFPLMRLGGDFTDIVYSTGYGHTLSMAAIQG